MTSRRHNLRWAIPHAAATSLVLAAGSSLAGTTAPFSDDEPIDYATQIQPILAENCFLCHGFDISTRKAGLELQIREGSVKPSMDGPMVIEPGQPEASMLVQRITSTDPDLRMPQGDRAPLSAEQIDLIRRWIEQGAEYSMHWAFRPIDNPDPPTLSDPNWPRDPLDSFILAKLDAQQIAPAPEASRRTLARRVYFDLTGLPPSPEQMEQFLADDSPDAYERLVDELLASPHFGEQWARYWLDLVRYAETHGHEYDYEIKYAWRYRDYVIRALNSDLPYDDFVREQIAGDLLDHPRMHSTDGYNESVIGTGWWYLHQATHSPVDPLADQAGRIDNQIDVFSKTFLAMTVSCARCHDHKFDPIPTQDYYSLSSFLQSSRRVEASLDQNGQVAHAAEALRGFRPTMETVLRDELVDSAEQLRAEAAAYVDAADEELTAAQLEERLLDAKKLDGWKAALKAWRETPLIDDPNPSATTFDTFDDLANWSIEGEAFSDTPSDSMQFSASGDTVAPAGVAHSGLLSGKLQGAMRSGEFVIQKPIVMYRMAGTGGRIRLMVDGYYLDDYNALIFDGMTFDGNTEGQWRTHVQVVLNKYVGHRAHFEILDEDDGWIAVDSIQFADARPARAEARDILGEINTLCDQLQTGRLDGVDSMLLNDLLQRELVPLDSVRLTGRAQRHQEVEKQVIAPIRALAIADGTGFDQPVYIRGDHRTPGVTAPRRFLRVIAGENQSPISHGSGRLELAERVLDPDNPLTSRVLVNRVWSYLFGMGIVESTDDFGALGRIPSHPKLLDHLADWFTHEGDWSFKALVRKLVLSSTYRMSSENDDPRLVEIDPQNTLLHAMRVRRLRAETIRDTLLAVSGDLNTQMYGPSVPVYLTQFMQGRGRPGKSGPLDGDGRRSIYLAVRRNFLAPFLQVFDAPVPSTTQGKRFMSNVPAQALSLMNDPFVHQEAQRWAQRMLQDESLDDEARIERMFDTALGRAPRDQELDLAIGFLNAQRAMHEGEEQPEQQAWKDLAHAMFNIKEFIFIE